MHHRTVEELMTRDVVRARRDMPFKEIVKLLADNDVTAVPVATNSTAPSAWSPRPTCCASPPPRPTRPA